MDISAVTVVWTTPKENSALHNLFGLACLNLTLTMETTDFHRACVGSSVSLIHEIHKALAFFLILSLSFLCTLVRAMSLTCEEPV